MSGLVRPASLWGLMTGAAALTPGHTIVQEPDQLSEMVQTLQDHRTRAFDFETDGLRYADGKKPIGYSLGVIDRNGHVRAWYVPFGHMTPEPQLPEEACKRAFKDALAGAPELVGHHLKFDLNMARANNWDVPEDSQIHDSLVQAYLTYERRAFQLEKVVDNEGIGYYGDAFEGKEAVDGFLRKRARDRKMRLKKDKPGDPSYLTKYGHSEVPIVIEGEYACRDVGHALLLDRKLRSAAMGVGMPWETQRRYLYANEMDLVRALADMEFNGQPIDADYLYLAHDQLMEDQEQRSRELTRLFGVRIDWTNDNEIRDLLFNHLRLPIVKKTSSDKPSVDRSALLQLRPHMPEPLKALAEFNIRQKVLTTYTESLAGHACADGRIHASFLQQGTKSGRLSGRGPNLQNVPTRHKEMAKLVRNAFYVLRGQCRLFLDYSQVELRVLAHVTGAKNLVQAYASEAYNLYRTGQIDYDTYRDMRQHEAKRDVHGEQAISTFNADPDAANWKLLRSAAKIINFGVPYGMSHIGLMTNPALMLDEDQAIAYFEAYHAANPEIETSKKRLFRHMCRSYPRHPMFVNWAGRTVHAHELRSHDKYERRSAERSVFASLIQGSAAELTKFSIVRIWRRTRNGEIPAKLTSTVHDEIQVDCEIGDSAFVARECQREMEAPFVGCFGVVPAAIADVERTVTTWAEKKDFDWRAAA